MIVNLDHPIVDEIEAMRLILVLYELKGWVWPTGQDAATFCTQEAMEMVDLFLREKNYVRNHDKELDGMGREAAQTLLMLLVTCEIAGVDLNAEFLHLVRNG